MAKLGELVKVNNSNKKPFSKEASHYLSVWVERDGKSSVILLTEGELSRAQYRATRNPEDVTKLEVPKKSWLARLFS